MQKKVLYVIVAIMICASGVFTLAFNSAIQMTSIFQTGYYRIFKNGKLIGNIQHFDEIKTEVVAQYGSKASGDIYFGDDIEIEYTSYEQPVTLSNSKDLIKLLDLQVEGLRVQTDHGKEFQVASYREWQNALGSIIGFIQSGETKSEQSNSIAGDVRVTENFRYTFEKMSLEEIASEQEVIDELIFSDIFDIATDVVQQEDTIASVAERNEISVEQLQYVNNLDTGDLLIPGTKLNVSHIDFAISFSYPVIETVLEDVAFEIEYIDDDNKYTDEEEIIQAGINGKANAQYLSYVINGEMVPGERLYYEVLEQPVKQIINRGTKVRSSLSSGSDAPYSNIAGFIWPTIGICISAEYMDPNYGGPHYALDIAGTSGESIWAVAAGTVESAGFEGSFGNQVMINHHNGLKTRYAHLSSIGVNVGQEVSQGLYIGGMGNTGLSFGTHLHFEVHADGSRVNPRPYLPEGGGPRTC